MIEIGEYYRRPRPQSIRSMVSTLGQRSGSGRPSPGMEAGNLSNVRGVGSGVLECRINVGLGCRVYFGRDGATLIVLLGGGTNSHHQRDVDMGKIVLRDYINATIGFEELGSLTNKPPKSLMRMFGPSGNPHARNLFEVISRIQQHEGVQLEVNAVR